MYLVPTLLQMRKLIIIILSLFPILTIAQVRTGVRGGINLTNFVYRPAYQGDTKGAGALLFRFNAGLQLEIPLNDEDNWFLYTGPYYNGKGNRVRVKYRTPHFDTIVTYLNYIELPLTVGYKIRSVSNSRITAGAGIYAAYGFKGRVEYHGSPERTKYNLHQKDSYYKRLDFGFSVSGIYEYKEKTGIRFDYSRSIPDISRNKWKEANNVFSFTFFWYLPSKEK
jgi:hypothetical protein